MISEIWLGAGSTQTHNNIPICCAPSPVINTLIFSYESKWSKQIISLLIDNLIISSLVRYDECRKTKVYSEFLFHSSSNSNWFSLRVYYIFLQDFFLSEKSYFSIAFWTQCLKCLYNVAIFVYHSISHTPLPLPLIRTKW